MQDHKTCLERFDALTATLSLILWKDEKSEHISGWILEKYGKEMKEKKTCCVRFSDRKLQSSPISYSLQESIFHVVVHFLIYTVAIKVFRQILKYRNNVFKRTENYKNHIKYFISIKYFTYLTTKMIYESSYLI